MIVNRYECADCDADAVFEVHEDDGSTGACVTHAGAVLDRLVDTESVWVSRI